MSKEVAFIFGSMNPYSMAGGGENPQFSEEEWAWMEGVTERLQIHAHPIWVVQDYEAAGTGRSDLGISRIRRERPRVVSEIDREGPFDLVVCFGPVASACLSARGDLVESEVLRRAWEWLGPTGPPVWVTFSMENARRSPSMREWIELDLEAAVRGAWVTEYGKYEVLQPGTPEWSVPPYPIFAKILVGDV